MPDLTLSIYDDVAICNQIVATEAELD